MTIRELFRQAVATPMPKQPNNDNASYFEFDAMRGAFQRWVVEDKVARRLVAAARDEARPQARPRRRRKARKRCVTPRSKIFGSSEEQQQVWPVRARTASSPPAVVTPKSATARRCHVSNGGLFEAPIKCVWSRPSIGRMILLSPVTTLWTSAAERQPPSAPVCIRPGGSHVRSFNPF